MDLRFRLNLVITLIMMLIALAGAIFSVFSARYSVEKEVNTSINVVNSMLDIGLQELETKQQPLQYLIHFIQQVEQQRHLSINIYPELTMPSANNPGNLSLATDHVPFWFVSLVRPEPQSLFREIKINNQIFKLILSDDPSDEIVEAWGESQGLFYLIALQSLLVLVLSHLILGQALKPLPALLKGLQQIESGHYNTRLEEFSLPEYKQITNAFNHAMSSLQIKTAENRLLTQHSLNLQEQERHTLARELHDELAQSLTGIKGVTSSIQLTCPQSKDATDTILSICDDLFLVIRSMMRRLRPSSLDELGLSASLEQLTNDWQQTHQSCHLNLNVKLQQPLQNNQLLIHIYRIIQESLNNISRHAQANQINIDLLEIPSFGLKLSISDNGIGFGEGNKHWGFGLLGIRERIESLNGTFQIRSEQGAGTTLTATIPIES